MKVSRQLTTFGSFGGQPTQPHRKTVVFLLVSLAGMCGSHAALGTDCFKYQTHFPTLGVADTPGDAAGVFVTDGYAYVADGAFGLAIIRVADPTAPTMIGAVSTPGSARAVAVAENLAVIAAGEAGIVVINVADPANPVVLGSLDTPGSAFDVTMMSGANLALVADYNTGLQVIDLSDPQSPVLLATVDTPGSAVEVVASGVHAYLADEGGGVWIVNVADPSAPTIAAHIPPWGYTVLDLDVQGDWLYFIDVDYNSVLRIANVVNPSAPIMFGALPVIGHSVDVDGDYAFVQSTLIYAIDIRNPAQPRLVGGTFCSNVDLVASGEQLYVAAGQSGLRIVDARRPESPLLGQRGGYNLTYSSVATEGALAYVTNFSLGDALLIIDTSSPGLPLVGVWYTSSTLIRLRVVDGRIFVLADNTLKIIDATDPTQPLLLGSLLLGGYGNGLAVVGTTVFIAMNRGALLAADVSNPQSPVLIGELPLPGSASRDVAVSGKLAAVAGDAAGLYTVDVSDPSSMSVLGHVYTSGEARSVSIVGPTAYVADGTAGLAIVDLADPQSPVLIGQADTPDVARSVTVDDGFAYVGDSGSGMQVIDILNLHSPRLIGGTYPGIGQTNHHNTYAAGSAVEMATTAEAICVAAGRGGLRLYPRQCGTTTGIAVTDLRADAVSDGIRVRCYVQEQLAAIALLRATGLGDERRWEPLAHTPSPPATGGDWEYVDTAVTSRALYGYMIHVTYRSGESATFGPVDVVAGGEVTSARVAPASNPASVPVHLVIEPTSGHAVVTIYDSAGRLVRRIRVDPRASGAHAVIWDGCDGTGRAMASGTYYLRMEGDDGRATGRVVLLR